MLSYCAIRTPELCGIALKGWEEMEVFSEKVWISTPTYHEEEIDYIKEAILTKLYRLEKFVCNHLMSNIIERGLCLPSDNKMKAETQDIIIQTIRSCFE